jgi:hypothetical protein
MEMMRIRNLIPAKLAIALSLLLLLSPLAVAQQGTGTILGTVTDTQGARVPGAKVALKDIDTGIATAVVSNSEGLYQASSLSIGKYQIETSMAGFKTASIGPVTLNVGQNRVVDFSLETGAVSEVVNVTTGVPTVDTTDTTIAWLVSQQQVEDLPLNGRNITQLMLLAPGIQPIPKTSSVASTIVPFGFGSPTRFSVAGGRPQGQLFLLDGTNTAGVWGNGTGVNLAGSSLGVDGIAEFQALTNTYDATFGGNGGVINAALRSGTNSLHGSVYEFNRNSALDARNEFANSNSALPFSRNQFGGTLGGPIVKDSTFFFVNYEGLQQSQTVPIITYVPDANFRNGYLPCYQTFGVTCDPTTNLAFVGVAPGIASYLSSYPAPNGGEIFNGNLPTGTALSNSSLTQPVAEHYGLAKVTRTLSPTDNLNLSYLVDDGSLTVYATPSVLDNDTQRNQYATIEETKTVSPTFLNVAHIAYARSNILVDTVYNPNLNIVPGSGFAGGIIVPGLSNLGGADTSSEVLDRYTLRDQISWVKGRNSIQAGLEAVRHALNVSIPIINGGDVLYTNLTPIGLPIQPNQAFLSNIPFVFEGVPLTADDSRRNVRHNNFSPYFQDKFQFSQNLTFNFGLRYDFESNPIETHGKFYNLVDPYTSPGFTHVPHAFATNITKWNLQPRVGFAWDPFGDRKTSIRGGFGIFDDLPLEMQVVISYLFNPPIYNIETILLPTIPNPFGSGSGGIPTGLPTGPQITAYQSKMNDYIMQYNLTVQRDVTHNMVATFAYVGSKANHLFVGQETNGCLPTGVTPGGLLIRGNTPEYANTCGTVNPNLGSVVARYPVGQSNYNSFQAALDRGVGQWAQFRISYTLSKCLDVGSYYTGNDSIGPNGATAGLQAGSLASNVRNVDYGPCDFDIRNNFTTNAVITLPYKGNRFKSGWQVTGIGTILSGTPFSVYDGYDQANVGAGGAADNAERPDLVPGRSNKATGRRNTAGGIFWFDPTAFTPQPIGVFGNLGRNTLTAPGFKDLDIGLSKNTKITESSVLQLRADAFNILNHSNLGFPNAQLYVGPGDGTNNATGVAGQITSGSAGTGGTGYERQIQLSAKFTF